MSRARAVSSQPVSSDTEYVRPASAQPARVRRRYVRPLRIVGLVLGIGLALIALEQLAYYNRVLPGVHVDGVAVDQRTDSAARSAIQDLARRLETRPIVARFGDRTLTTTPQAIGLRVDVDGTLDDARAAGRRNLNPLEIIASPFRRLFGGDNVALRTHWDEHKVDAVLAAWEKDSVTGFVPGDVTFDGTKAVAVPPKTGITVDAVAARAPFERELQSGTRHVATLPTKPVESTLTAAQVQRVTDEATAILRAPFEIVSGFTVVTITPQQLVGALTTTRGADGSGLALSVDPARLAAAVGTAAAPFATPAVDARFVVNTDNTVSVVPSQDGRALDFAALAAPILAQQRRIDAQLSVIHPEHDTAWAGSLGIKEQVSSFTTQHPCCASRVTNIHRAADLIQDHVVLPGQVFSLNEAIGPRTAARGFVEAPVFYQKFTTDIGGGVSQLSTTVYNAAWWGGFEIVEHQPHSIWISRYPAGREATLNYGTIDNRFRNNSHHGILIHTSYTDTSITVSIYGDKEGKVVREENRQVTAGVQAAGEPFTVVYDRVIDQPGQPEVREHYRWKYDRAPPG
jgi:vancomycin resistance protein YoaR